VPTSQKFEDVQVELDGQTFERCVFVNCDLIYRGGAIPMISGCTFVSCEWLLRDAALRTLGYFGRLHEIGASDVVAGFFDIARSSTALPEEPIN
jgi:hypothetical protein